MEQDFIIDKVEWHTKKIRDYEFDNSLIYEYFRSLINYLQKNNLTKKNIIAENEDLDENTSIKKSDLTEEGCQLIKICYSKWVDKVVDQKISSTNYKILDNALKKIRSGNSTN